MPTQVKIYPSILNLSIPLPSMFRGSTVCFWQAINGAHRRLNIFQIRLTWEEMYICLNQSDRAYNRRGEFILGASRRSVKS